MEAVVGVDDVDVHQNLLGDVTEQEDRSDGDHAAVTEQGERADGIGPGPGEGASVFFRERFGEDEEAVKSVDEREATGHPEGKARIDVAEETSDGGTEDESGSKGCVQDAEGGGAALAWGDVGHVGHRGRDGRGGNAGDDAAEEEPVERRGPGHEEIVEPEAEVGEQNDGAAAVTVGERADDGREEELHGGEDRSEEAEHAGCAGCVAMEKAFDEAGKDRGDHAECEHVEGDGEEDKGGGGATAFGWMRSEGGRDEFGLGEERVRPGGGRVRRVFDGVGHLGGIGSGGMRLVEDSGD